MEHAITIRAAKLDSNGMENNALLSHVLQVLHTVAHVDVVKLQSLLVQLAPIGMVTDAFTLLTSVPLV